MYDADWADDWPSDPPGDRSAPIWVPPPPRIHLSAVVHPVPIDPTGKSGPTRGMAQRSRWRRTSPGLFVPAHVDSTEPTQRIVEAAGHLPPGGAVTGWAALHLRGARWFDGTKADGSLRPVPLSVPHRLRRRPAGVLIRRHRDPLPVEPCHDVPCLGVERAILDAMLLAGGLRERVRVLAMACYAELTSVSRFGAWVDRWAYRHPHVRAIRTAISLTVEGAESPPEVSLALVWMLDADLPPPLCNATIYDFGGGFLARVDLLDPDLGVVGEYDGKHDRETSQRGKDVDREEVLRDHGLEYFSVVAGQLGQRDRIVQRIRQTGQRAAASSRPRRWTLEPPGRSPALTLDERLDLRERS